MTKPRHAWHAAAPTFLPSGTEIAGYRIESAIGQGGMGVVYEAMQVSLNRIVALKLLAPHLSEDAVFRERFRREGMLQAGLDHPHIVTVHEAGETDYGLFLAMRLVRGPRLKDLIVAEELDTARALHLLTAAGDALDAAHEAGLIHRDVKPQNILVGPRDHAYLADFGLTKLPGEKSLTDTGQFMGTLDYIAPEQIVGERATVRSDVYALAGVLYESLTGSVPFLRETEAAVLYAHLSDDPPRPSEKNPELPEALDEVIARAMSKVPDERPGSVGELMDEVEEAFAGAAPAAARRRTPRRSPPPDETVPPGLDPDVVAAAAAPTEGFATKALPEVAQGRGVFRWWPAAIAVAVAVALGVLAGIAGDDEPDAGSDALDVTGVLRAAGNRLEIGVPAGWIGANTPEALPGLELAGRVQVLPREAEREGLLVGRVRQPGPSLLPSDLTARLDDRSPRPGRVRLGRLEALRFAKLDPRGTDRVLTVFVAPYSGGVAGVACYSRPRVADDFLPGCERVAGTLRLLAGEPESLTPSEDYAAALDRVMVRLNRARRTDRARLARAKRPRAQAEIARRLAGAFERADRSLAGAGPGRTARYAHAALRSSARDAARGYRRLASSAAGGNARGYGAAREAIRDAEASFQEAIGGLAALGYKIR